MNKGVCVLLVAVCLLTPGTIPCRGAESAPALDAVLVRWEHASREVRTFDAKLTRITYSAVFNDEKRAEGRFYYEAPDHGYLEVVGDDTFASTNDGLFIIRHQDKTCTLWSPKTIQAARERLREMPEGTFWQRFWKGYTLLFTWPATISRPDDLLPLFLNTNTQTVQKRLDFVKVEQNDGRIFLKAVPKEKNSPLYREIDVAIEAESYVLLAHRSVVPSGNKTVYVFTDVKINKPPADRNALIRPIPPGYTRLSADSMLFGKD